VNVNSEIWGEENVVMLKRKISLNKHRKTPIEWVDQEVALMLGIPAYAVRLKRKEIERLFADGAYHK